MSLPKKELVEAWRRTWLRIVDPEGHAWAIHGADQGHTEGGFPLDHPVHVLTSWNPASTQIPDSENQDRHRELIAEVTTKNLSIWEGTGVAGNGEWAESGVALTGLPLEEVIEWAKRWQQDAIWEWHPNGLAVVECLTGQRHEWGWIRTALPSRSPFEDSEGIFSDHE